MLVRLRDQQTPVATCRLAESFRAQCRWSSARSRTALATFFHLASLRSTSLRWSTWAATSALRSQFPSGRSSFKSASTRQATRSPLTLDHSHSWLQSQRMHCPRPRLFLGTCRSVILTTPRRAEASRCISGGIRMILRAPAHRTRSAMLSEPRQAIRSSSTPTSVRRRSPLNRQAFPDLQASMNTRPLHLSLPCRCSGSIFLRKVLYSEALLYSRHR